MCETATTSPTPKKIETNDYPSVHLQHPESKILCKTRGRNQYIGKPNTMIKQKAVRARALPWQGKFISHISKKEEKIDSYMIFISCEKLMLLHLSALNFMNTNTELNRCSELQTPIVYTSISKHRQTSYTNNTAVMVKVHNKPSL